jgi:hypothetical protein
MIRKSACRFPNSTRRTTPIARRRDPEHRPINAYMLESFVLKFATSRLAMLNAHLFGHGRKVHSFFAGPIQ